MSVEIYSPILYNIGGAIDSPLEIRDNYFYHNGELWFWNGFTAFLASKRYLTGNENDADNYMDWVVSEGGNLIRVFSQVKWDGPPGTGVEQGFFAKDFPDYDDKMHRMFDTAASKGLFIEFVHHTFPQSMDAMLEHSDRCDKIVSAHPNGVNQDSNEPPVNGIDIAGIVSKFKPHRLGSSGQYDPSPYPGRVTCDDHPPRDDEFCRKFKGAWEAYIGDGPYAPFTPAWKNPYYFGEPERIERTGSSDDWRAWAAGARLFAAGTTIHGGDWAQRCIIPTDSATLSKIRAYQLGIRDVPHQKYFGYQHPDDNGALRRYRRQGEDSHWYEITVRPYSFRQV